MTVEELKIGGRNLVPDTEFKRGVLNIEEGGHGLYEVKVRTDDYGGHIPLYEGRKYIHAYADAEGDKYYYLKPEISINPGETYTVRFYSRFAGSINGNSTYFRFNTGDHIRVPVKLDYGYANQWVLNSYTFVAPLNATDVSLRFGFYCTDHAWLAISSIKLEKGNVATDWSPAPEDFATMSDIPTSLPASDVYAWAKKSTKPSYSASEISGLPTVTTGTGNPPTSGMKKGDIFIKTS